MPQVSNSDDNSPQMLYLSLCDTAIAPNPYEDNLTGSVETLPPPQPHNLEWLVDLEEEEDVEQETVRARSPNNADRITGSVGTSPPPPQRVFGRVVDLEDEVDSEHAGEDSGRGASVQTT